MKSIINFKKYIFLGRKTLIGVFLPLFAIFSNIFLHDSSEEQAYLEEVT